MQHWKLSLLFVSVMMFSAGGILRADIAPDPLSGGKNLTAKGERKDVAMTSEKVELVVSPERTDVTAVFNLTNTKDATTLQVGFPMNYETDLMDFKLKINDKAIPTELKKEKYKDPLGRERTSLWYVWDMKFDKGESCTVEVKYWNKPTGQYGISYDEGSWTSEWPPDEISEKFKRLSSGYILASGAGWAGPIGKAEIAVRFKDMSMKDLLRSYSPLNNATLEDNAVKWVYENFDPEANGSWSWKPDIEVVFCAQGTVQDEIKAFEKLVSSANDELNGCSEIHIARLYDVSGNVDKAAASFGKILSRVTSRPRRDGKIVLADSSYISDFRFIVDATRRLARMARQAKGDTGELKKVLEQFRGVLKEIAEGKFVDPDEDSETQAEAKKVLNECK